jgi:hypothetical protein
VHPIDDHLLGIGELSRTAEMHAVLDSLTTHTSPIHDPRGADPGRTGSAVVHRVNRANSLSCPISDSR